jgi:enoyl-CoA hydratase
VTYPVNEASVSISEAQGAAPTGEDAIRRERVGEHLLVIRIDRPHRRKAFDGATARAMEVAAVGAYESKLARAARRVKTVASELRPST